MTQRTRSTIAVTLSCLLAATTVTFGADKSSKSNKSKSDNPAAQEAARYPVPAGLRGFDGTLGGTVVSVNEHNSRGFVLKINHVLHSNARSTAPDPKSAVGQQIEITPTTTKDANGKWVPDQHEVDFIRSLKKGQDIQIDVANTDPHHFRIADLTKAEKQQADQQKKKESKSK